MIAPDVLLLQRGSLTCAFGSGRVFLPRAYVSRRPMRDCREDYLVGQSFGSSRNGTAWVRPSSPWERNRR